MFKRGSRAKVLLRTMAEIGSLSVRMKCQFDIQTPTCR
jgi:hypothetical protein